MLGRKLINIPVLIISLVLMVVGYKLLGTGPVDSAASWKFAPVILVTVYAILVPLSVLLKSNK